MIGQWENDLRKPKYGTLKKLADALGVWVDDLYAPDDIELQQKRIPEDIVVRPKPIEDLRRADKLDYTIFPRGERSEKLSSENLQRLAASIDRLNPTGQEEAIKRVEELTEIPRYQKTSPPQEAPTDSETTADDTLSGNKNKHK